MFDKLKNNKFEGFLRNFGKWYPKQNDDTYISKHISSIVSLVLSLRYSNAKAEQIFIVVTDCIREKRNYLGSDTLNAIAVFPTTCKDCGETCLSFEIQKQHLQ